MLFQRVSRDMRQFKTYELSTTERQEMLDNAIIVLDTCAICSLYNLTEHYRAIMITILGYIKERIWLPRQVLFEYEKNRCKSINNPKSEKYRDPLFTKDHFVVDVRDEIKRWKSNDYWHPYLDSGIISLLEKEIEEANKHIRIIKETVTEQYKKRREEIDAIANNDPLEKFVHSLCVEDELSISYLKEVAKEGEQRYAFNLPPGYMDRDKPEEGDPFRRFGDLIIWKSIIAFAKKKSKDIVYVSDDLKEDWVLDNKPRPELISEFQEETGQRIDIYSLPQFIEAIKFHYNDREAGLPLFDELESVIDALNRLEKERLDESGFIELKCDECGHIFKVHPDELWLEWDSEGESEREMGLEQEWYCEEHIECPYCDNSIDIEMSASEYPQGIINDFDINCLGAKKVGFYKKEIFLPNIDDDYSV